MIRWLLLFLICSGPAVAETVFAARTLRPHTVLKETDLLVKNVNVSGAYDSVRGLVGMETQVAIYAGHPVRRGEVGPAAIVQRNQPVVLIYNVGGLLISSEGRALARAAVGQRIQVMNLSSRRMIQGVVTPDGNVSVGMR